MTDEPALHPACLPVGTRVGGWRVVAWRGRGVYGAVYLAVREGEEGADPVALKIAVHPDDPRFAREVELLSRIRHPSVPRLHDHGHWRNSEAIVFPFVVMEWIEGLSLYDWAAIHRPTSQQLLQILAQLARALEATEAVGGVHRDVKGDNIRVRVQDGRAFLMDFGAGHYAGASKLTWWPMPQGTPAYLSPEARRFVQRFGKDPAAYYAARPTDDLYALGVTAWRLVMGEYPPATPDEGQPGLSSANAGSRPLLSLDPGLDPRLHAFIVRMLSVDPEARGTARELAEGLEKAAKWTGPEEARFPSLHPPRGAGSPSRIALLFVGLFLSIGLYASTRQQDEVPVVEQIAPDVGSVDAGTSGLGEEVLSAPIEVNSESSFARRGMGLEVPREPLPGQMRPDSHGKCRRRLDVAIRGGCWTPIANTKAPCVEDAYDYQGTCYYPAFQGPRQPTSEVP